ncbi:MAG: hypothetical protein ACUVRV_06285 [Cyanobacteriota bacterium]
MVCCAAPPTGSLTLTTIGNAGSLIPFFVHPQAEVDLTPLPACVAGTGGIPIFSTLTAGEYLNQALIKD